MNIGERIKTLRKNAGYTQKGLAIAAGIALVSLQQYERGVRQPRIDQLQKIASALNVPVLDLLGPYDGPQLPGLVDGEQMEFTEPFHYSPVRNRVNSALDKLNHEGQQKAVERVEELTEIPKYQKAGNSTENSNTEI